MDAADAVDDEPLAWGTHLPARVRQLYTLGARPLLVSAVALVTGAFAAAAPPDEVVGVLVVPLVLALVLQRRLVGRAPRGGHGRFVLADGTAVGTFVVPRIVVLAALLPTSREDGTRMATIAVLAAALLAEPVLRTLLRRAVPYAFHVPAGYGAVRNWPFLEPTLAWLGWLLAAVSAILSQVAGRAEIVGLVAATVTLGLVVVLGVDAFGRTTARLRFERQIPALLAEIAPAMLLHWESVPGTGYQVRMWLPYLDRVGAPYVIVLRDPLNVPDVFHAATVPVIVRPALEQLDEIAAAPSLRVALYVNTATKNQHLVRYPNLTHVQLNHGDSDKAPSHNPAFRLYDRNYVAGQAAIDRFAANGVRVQDDFFRVVGRPQVERVQPAPAAPRTPVTALYAPTWRGFYTDSDYSSLRVGVDIVRTLLDRGLRVVFRPHPFARNDGHLARCCDEIIGLLTADAAATGRDHVYGPRAEDVEVVECFNLADVMLSDVSSVLGDFLHSEKPYVLLAAHGDRERFRREVPLSEGGYVVDTTAERPLGVELWGVLDRALGEDPARARRALLRTHYLGEIPRDTYADHFVTVLRAEIGLPPA